jgi:hypothetical protein
LINWAATAPPQVIEALVKTPPQWAVLFVAPRSERWPAVKAICAGAKNFLCDGKYSLAVFDNTRNQLSLFKQVLEFCRSWGSAVFFVGGATVVQHELECWLGCYIQSAMVEDIRAHCIVAGYRELGANDYYLPCRHLLGWGRIDRKHPSAPSAQIQAIAVRKGIVMCPNFNMKNFLDAPS